MADSRSITVRFPGGQAVEADTGSFTVRTDQPLSAGGGGSAPSPFDLFLTSIATCAGYYAHRFCTERAISTVGLSVRLDTEKDPARPRIAKITLDLTLPEVFPAKYRGAILRAVDQCSVKRHLLEPPAFEVVAHEVEPAEELVLAGAQ